MSVTSLLYKYPLDLTGKNPTNLVLREPHTVGTTSQRAFVTNAGPFYTKDVVVREAVSGRILIPYEQYLILQPYQEASVKTGLEVASIIYITDLTVDTEILVDYQVVGGEFSWTVYALKAMLESLDLDSRPVHWGDIVGRPTEFRPSPHLHDLGDSYGWEYVANQLEGIRNAILLGDAASHDELRQQLALMIESLRDVTDSITAALEAHKANHTNPHVVTAAHVGLGNVLNSRHATDAEANSAANINNAAPTTTYVIDTKNLAAAMRSFNNVTLVPHLADFNNPHKVDKTDVGLSLINNWDISTKVEAEAGASNVKYMTPLRTKEAINVLALVPLNTHIGDATNPHKTTKAQVGLGNLVNELQATVNEAESATNPGIVVPGVKYVNLSGLNAAFNLYYRDITRLHLNDDQNPHKTTKAQVGLDLVSNFPLANVQDAQSAYADNEIIFSTWDRYSHGAKVQWTLAEAVGANLIRFNNGVYYKALINVPANTQLTNTTYWKVNDEATSFEYNSALDTINSTINSSTHIGMVTDMVFKDFDFIADVSSDDTDDDYAGLVAAYFKAADGTESTITVLRNQGTVNGFAVYYNLGFPNARLLFQSQGGIAPVLVNSVLYNPYRILTPGMDNSLKKGWTYRNTVNDPWLPVKFRLRARRIGNRFIFYTSAPNSTTFLTGTDVFTLDLDLPVNADLAALKGSNKIGYMCLSQEGVTWKAISFPWRRNDVYMTPTSTKYELDYFKLKVLNDAYAPKSHSDIVAGNPHGTTKAHVGLGNVENYLFATKLEAESGASATKYMSPVNVAQAIAVQAIVPLNNHINNYTNPHNTTKAQVGLGNIPNAITDLRSLNSSATLLTAKGMFDHSGSADHDARYKPYGQAMEGSLTTYLGCGFMYINGAWRQFWPPLWQ